MSNEAIATGRAWVDYDPLTVLQELQSAISYSPAFGYLICLSNEQRLRIHRCVAFNKGEEFMVGWPTDTARSNNPEDSGDEQR